MGQETLSLVILLDGKRVLPRFQLQVNYIRSVIHLPTNNNNNSFSLSFISRDLLLESDWLVRNTNFSSMALFPPRNC